MKLRELKIEDAPLMLEWMHDISVVKDLKANFASKTIQDCENFIGSAKQDQANLHLAIADDQDVYMGTVSLKNIENEEAEFAIVIRTAAMGHGFSRFGMQKIIEKGFEELGLKRIYWCVDPVNQRAVRFYDKNGYQRCAAPKNVSGYTEEETERFIWYQVLA